MSKLITVNLPDIGEGVVEGEVIEWLKQPGDDLKQDEPVVIVMTDKATVELPAPAPGKLSKQYFEVGGIAIRDKPLYDIEVADATKENSEATKGKALEEPLTVVEKPSKQTMVHSTGPHIKAAPPVRKLAHDLGIDIDKIQGTGVDGHVTSEDVVKFHGSNAPTVQLSAVPRLPGSQEKPLLGIRNLMAKRMSESHSSIPHFSYFEELDATRLVQLRQTFKEEAAKQSVSVTYMPFIIRALSLSLKRYPIVNSFFDTAKNCIVLHQLQNIGIAITTKQGLIVPVLKNVQDMSLQQIILAYDDLKKRALAGKLQSVDMKDSTITISNFGVLGGGGVWATPIINYPEVAILGVARIHKQPVVRNDAVVVRDLLNLSWSFDHRVIDGDLAATFSHHLSTLLQNPAPLL